jgi:hydrogenase maturation protease
VTAVTSDTGREADLDRAAPGGSPPPDAVAVGVGNPTRRDDGLGRAVVRRLDVPATFAGTTAFLALEAMSGCRQAVVVDAVDAAGPPGTVHRFPLDAVAPEVPELTLHDLTFGDAVEAAADTYDLPERLTVVGAVPARTDGGIGVSDPVGAALPATVAAVEAELGVRQRPGGTSMDAHWYCHDCDSEIGASAVEDHERRGHSVTGRLRPERLLSQDPWETGEDGGGG